MSTIGNGAAISDADCNLLGGVANLAQIRAVADCMPVLAWSCLPDGYCDYLSCRWVEFTGVPEDEHHGRGWLTAIHPDDRDRTGAGWDAFIAGEAPYDVDYRLRRHDGAYVWFKTRGMLVRDADGRPVRVVGATTDIDAQMQAEARVREIDERALFVRQVSGVGFWYCDLPFDELQWDALVKEHFHLPSDARVTVDTFYERIHPDDREPTRAAIQRCIEDCEPYDVQYRTVDPVTGATRWIRAIGRTFYAADGTPRRFDGVTLDVTEQRRAEEQLRDADRRKDEFIAVLAHELRNPLAPLRNGLQVMRLAGIDGAATDEARAMMERQLGHMVRLIDDLLDVSRISQNKLELRRGRVLLSDVVTSAVETARPALDAAGHELTVALPAELIYLDADLTRLAQVFSNLLTNAAKYTEAGGRVWLAARAEPSEVVVTVRDSGIGIPALALPTIFDMFSQVDRSLERATGGLGIGLALVRGLVEMHGGRVEAASDGAGAGSTFTVTLPREPAKAAAPPVAANDECTPAAGPARRILVVDDNRDSASSMAKILSMLGHEVRLAYDGLDAVAAAEDFRPNVILMDVGMPRLNGYEATRHIRQQVWGAGVTIIALTGWGQDGDRTESRAAGCDEHLVKPVQVGELMRLIAERAG
jgi:PAS domain S-box-containing protein